MDINNKIAAAIFSFDKKITKRIISNLKEIELVSEIIIVSDTEISDNVNFVKSADPVSGEAIKRVIEKTSTKYLMFINGSRIVKITGKCC